MRIKCQDKIEKRQTLGKARRQAVPRSISKPAKKIKNKNITLKIKEQKRDEEESRTKRARKRKEK